ncbi:MAG: pyruvate/2-oxoglutarate/acetoin dehydrogenase E1 component, partial [Flavobacteriaceae bacterium]
YLDAPVQRMGAMDVPIPFSPALEDVTVPTVKAVYKRATELVRNKFIVPVPTLGYSA